MGDEKGLAVRAERKVDTRPRVGGMLAHRMDRVRSLLEAELLRDVKDLSLARYCFTPDEELDAVWHNGRRLTARQRRLIRELEKSKRESATSLSFAHERVLHVMRAQSEQKTISINVERAVIRVPDTRQDDAEDAVVIDVDAHATG